VRRQQHTPTAVHEARVYSTLVLHHLAPHEKRATLSEARDHSALDDMTNPNFGRITSVASTRTGQIGIQRVDICPSSAITRSASRLLPESA